MKICYLANAQSIHTYRWVQYFAQRGHQVSLVSLKEPKFDYGKVEVKVIKKIRHKSGAISHLMNFLPVFFQIKKILKKNNPNILHVISVAGEGWLGTIAGFHPLVITTGGTDVLINPKEFKGYEILTRRTLKKADLITCDGENGKTAMIDLGANPKKIKIIHFGVEIDKFKPGMKDENLKKELFGEGGKIILSTKPLRRECSVETLIKAIK